MLSTSRELSLSLMALSIFNNPILYWFSKSSPTDLTLRLPKWSISSTSPIPSINLCICLTTSKISDFSSILLLIEISFLNFELIFNLPTAERSYLSSLKKRLLNNNSAVSIVGGSPGLKIL